MGLTQEDLVENLECEIGTLQNVEAGRFRKPSTIRMIADFLNSLHREKGWPLILVPSQPAVQASWLNLPEREWDAAWCGPGSLLNAEFGVVTFHGESRERELEELLRWCRAGDKASVRVCKGAGGMGKTRLALELCRRLAKGERESWTAGFIEAGSVPLNQDPWVSVPLQDRPALLVMDYAGDKRHTPALCHLLRWLKRCPALRVRLLLLDRDDLWLGRLFDDKEARTVLLGSHVVPDNFRIALKPVAATMPEREISFELALRAFCRQLEVPTPKRVRRQLSGPLFNQVLFIHSQALLAAFGEEAAAKEKLILRHLLHREREYWRRKLGERGLTETLLPAVEEAVYAVSLNGGASDLKAAQGICCETSLLGDQAKAIVCQVALLLRECYPARGGGIAPLQPDTLREFLAEEFLGRTRRR